MSDDAGAATMMTDDTANGAEAPPSTPKTAQDWGAYIPGDVRHTTPAGTSRIVRLLQVKADAASIRRGKGTRPVWVPLKEISPAIVNEKRKGPATQRGEEGERYVLVDLRHHSFFFIAKGRGGEAKWVDDPSVAASYGDINSAWAARRYHGQKRALMFPPHIEIKALSEATALYREWKGLSSETHPVGQLARDILAKSLPAAPAPKPGAAPAPISGELTELYEAWAFKRQEVSTAEVLLATAQAELAKLSVQLDLELKRRQLA